MVAISPRVFRDLQQQYEQAVQLAEAKEAEVNQLREELDNARERARELPGAGELAAVRAERDQATAALLVAQSEKANAEAKLAEYKEQSVVANEVTGRLRAEVEERKNESGILAERNEQLLARIQALEQRPPAPAPAPVPDRVEPAVAILNGENGRLREDLRAAREQLREVQDQLAAAPPPARDPVAAVPALLGAENNRLRDEARELREQLRLAQERLAAPPPPPAGVAAAVPALLNAENADLRSRMRQLQDHFAAELRRARAGGEASASEQAERVAEMDEEMRIINEEWDRQLAATRRRDAEHEERVGALNQLVNDLRAELERTQILADTRWAANRVLYTLVLELNRRLPVPIQEMTPEALQRTQNEAASAAINNGNNGEDAKRDNGGAGQLTRGLSPDTIELVRRYYTEPEIDTVTANRLVDEIKIRQDEILRITREKQAADRRLLAVSADFKRIQEGGGDDGAAAPMEEDGNEAVWRQNAELREQIVNLQHQLAESATQNEHEKRMVGIQEYSRQLEMMREAMRIAHKMINGEYEGEFVAAEERKKVGGVPDLNAFLDKVQSLTHSVATLSAKFVDNRAAERSLATATDQAMMVWAFMKAERDVVRFGRLEPGLPDDVMLFDGDPRWTKLNTDYRHGLGNAWKTELARRNMQFPARTVTRAKRTVAEALRLVDMQADHFDMWLTYLSRTLQQAFAYAEQVRQNQPAPARPLPGQGGAGRMDTEEQQQGQPADGPAPAPGQRRMRLMDGPGTDQTGVPPSVRPGPNYGRGMEIDPAPGIWVLRTLKQMLASEVYALGRDAFESVIPVGANREDGVREAARRLGELVSRRLADIADLRNSYGIESDQKHPETLVKLDPKAELAVTELVRASWDEFPYEPDPQSGMVIQEINGKILGELSRHVQRDKFFGTALLERAAPEPAQAQTSAPAIAAAAESKSTAPEEAEPGPRPAKRPAAPFQSAFEAGPRLAGSVFGPPAPPNPTGPSREQEWADEKKRAAQGPAPAPDVFNPIGNLAEGIFARIQQQMTLNNNVRLAEQYALVLLDVFGQLKAPIMNSRARAEIEQERKSLEAEKKQTALQRQVYEMDNQSKINVLTNQLKEAQRALNDNDAMTRMRTQRDNMAERAREMRDSAVALLHHLTVCFVSLAERYRRAFMAEYDNLVAALGGRSGWAYQILLVPMSRVGQVRYALPGHMFPDVEFVDWDVSHKFHAALDHASQLGLGARPTAGPPPPPTSDFIRDEEAFILRTANDLWLSKRSRARQGPVPMVGATGPGAGMFAPDSAPAAMPGAPTAPTGESAELETQALAAFNREFAEAYHARRLDDSVWLLTAWLEWEFQALANPDPGAGGDSDRMFVEPEVDEASAAAHQAASQFSEDQQRLLNAFNSMNTALLGLEWDASTGKIDAAFGTRLAAQLNQIWGRIETQWVQTQRTNGEAINKRARELQKMKGDIGAVLTAVTRATRMPLWVETAADITSGQDINAFQFRLMTLPARGVNVLGPAGTPVEQKLVRLEDLQDIYDTVRRQQAALIDIAMETIRTRFQGGAVADDKYLMADRSQLQGTILNLKRQIAEDSQLRMRLKRYQNASANAANQVLQIEAPGSDRQDPSWSVWQQAHQELQQVLLVPDDEAYTQMIQNLSVFVRLYRHGQGVIDKLLRRVRQLGIAQQLARIQAAALRKTANAQAEYDVAQETSAYAAALRAIETIDGIAAADAAPPSSETVDRHAATAFDVVVLFNEVIQSKLGKGAASVLKHSGDHGGPAGAVLQLYAVDPQQAVNEVDGENKNGSALAQARAADVAALTRLRTTLTFATIERRLYEAYLPTVAGAFTQILRLMRSMQHFRNAPIHQLMLSPTVADAVAELIAIEVRAVEREKPQRYALLTALKGSGTKHAQLVRYLRDKVTLASTPTYSSSFSSVRDLVTVNLDEFEDPFMVVYSD